MSPKRWKNCWLPISPLMSWIVNHINFEHVLGKYAIQNVLPLTEHSKRHNLLIKLLLNLVNTLLTSSQKSLVTGLRSEACISESFLCKSRLFEVVYCCCFIFREERIPRLARLCETNLWKNRKLWMNMRATLQQVASMCGSDTSIELAYEGEKAGYSLLFYTFWR